MDCADSPGEMRVTDDPGFEFEPVQFTGTHGDGEFRLELPSGVQVAGSYTASEIEGRGEHSGSYSACDGVAGLDGLVIVDFGWTREFLATRPTPTAETSPTTAADDAVIPATHADSTASAANEGTVGVEAQDAVPPASSDEGGGIPAAVIIGTVVLAATGVAIATRLGVGTSGAAPPPPPPPPPPEPMPPEPPGPDRYPRGPGDKAEPRGFDPSDDGIDPTDSESGIGTSG